MLTLGVDLASQSKNTGICRLSWTESGTAVETLHLGATDDDILAAAEPCDAIGIDAPFGWPDAFVELVNHHHRATAPEIDWSNDTARAELRLRATDRFIWRRHFPRPPLSVSADAIAMPAMRCAGLLRRLGVDDRATNGRVFEAYPALALQRWIGRSKGYKGAKGQATRQIIIDELRQAAPSLPVPPECAGSDDLLDALLSALVARAARLGKVLAIPDELAQPARREGWIVVPDSPLAEL